MKKEMLLGVPIHALRWKGLKTVLFEFLRTDHSHFVVTVNPEILVHASRDKHYRALLQRADLGIADGVGLRIISWVHTAIRTRRKQGTMPLSGPLPATLPGVDVARWLLDVANHEQYAVTCVLWKNGRTSADALQRALSRMMPRVPVQCVVSDREEPQQNLLRTIAAHHPRILFIGLGAPFQEQWLAHALPHLPSVRLGMGVGGTFDYWAGRAHRAPRWMRVAGCEWLWRVLQEPQRFRRILRAVVIFPLLALKDILRSR